jgi:hypothetical protein
MKPTNPLLTLFATILSVYAAAAQAAGVDMNDPHRALGREDDVRVDAQLVRDTVSPGTPIGVTYQIQNLSKEPVALAARAAHASYDEDSRTVTLALGSEVPPDGTMPEMTVIAPGEKKVFRTAATPAYPASAMRGTFAATPRYVQVKVAILRNLEPFRPLIDNKGRARQRLTDEQFEKWLESNDTIFLNTLPVHFTASRPAGAAELRGSF